MGKGMGKYHGKWVQGDNLKRRNVKRKSEEK